MSVNEEHSRSRETETPAISPGNYSPVTVYVSGNTLIAIFLGILTGILLIGWIRTEARYHALLAQLVFVEKGKFTIPE